MICLMYHDVVEPNCVDASGFPGASAARYKLSQNAFQSHLAALAEALPGTPSRAGELLSNPAKDHFLLTFDDGGRSAAAVAAPMLEARGWRGHFLVTTDFIDTAPFLTTHQIRELHRVGHVIGS